MNEEFFDKCYRHILQKARNARKGKESEYFSKENIIRSFEEIGRFRSKSTPETIMDLGTKSLQSLSDLVNHNFGKGSPLEPTPLSIWEERFIDSLNYLFKLYATVRWSRGD